MTSVDIGEEVGGLYNVAIMGAFRTINTRSRGVAANSVRWMSPAERESRRKCNRCECYLPVSEFNGLEFVCIPCGGSSWEPKNRDLWRRGITEWPKRGNACTK